MRKQYKLVCVVLLALLAALWTKGLGAHAAAEAYIHRGNISAIDLTFDTVVVEVPLGDDFMTIGGPLVESAELKKGNCSADLSDFSIGEAVTVKWRSTESGHRILALFSR